MYPIKIDVSKHQIDQDIEANKNKQQKSNGFLAKTSLKCVWINFSSQSNYAIGHRAVVPPYNPHTPIVRPNIRYRLLPRSSWLAGISSDFHWEQVWYAEVFLISEWIYFTSGKPMNVIQRLFYWFKVRNTIYFSVSYYLSYLKESDKIVTILYL